MKGRNSLRTFLAFAFLLVFISYLGILPLLGLRGSQSISSYGTVSYPAIVVDKRVIWNDGSIETIKIDGKGHIFLDGRRTVAFGLNIVAIKTVNKEILANKVLDKCREYGIRFMILDVLSWLDSTMALQDWIYFWMPKLYDRKMMVLLWIQHRPEPPILDVDAAFERISNIIDGITNQTWANMIFAIGYNWELDLGTWGFADKQVEDFLSSLYPLMRNKIDASIIGKVPIVGKHSSVISPRGTVAIIKYSDVPNWDFYFGLPNWKEGADSRMKTYRETTLPRAGKSGYCIWFAEHGTGLEGQPANDQYTPAMFRYILEGGGYKDVSAVFFWVLQWDRPDAPSYNYAAFDMDGNPKPWFKNLAPYFPRSS